MPAKKAAKKAAAKHADPKHHERKDLRRAYEHLGRVEVLQRVEKGEFSKPWDESDESEHHDAVAALFKRSLEGAEKALSAGSYRHALEVSRGAEALVPVKNHGTKHLEGRNGAPKAPEALAIFWTGPLRAGSASTTSHRSEIGSHAADSRRRSKEG